MYDTEVLLYEWHDFAIFGYRNGDRCNTQAKRRDVSNAVNRNKEKVEIEILWERGLLVQYDDIVWGDDVFEAMRFTKYGGVTIWTKNKVWSFRHEGGDEVSIDKLFYLERNPCYWELKP